MDYRALRIAEVIVRDEVNTIVPHWRFRYSSASAVGTGASGQGIGSRGSGWRGCEGHAFHVFGRLRNASGTRMCTITEFRINEIEDLLALDCYFGTVEAFPAENVGSSFSSNR